MVTSHHGAFVLIACLWLTLLPRSSEAAYVGMPQFSPRGTQVHRYHDSVSSIYSVDKLAPHILRAPPSFLARLEPLSLTLVSEGHRQKATSNAVEGAEEADKENGTQESSLFQNIPEHPNDISLLIADMLGAPKLRKPYLHDDNFGGFPFPEEESVPATLRAAAVDAAVLVPSPQHTNKIDSSHPPYLLYDPTQAALQPQTANSQPQPRQHQQAEEREMVKVKKWWGKSYRPQFKETRKNSYNRKKSTHYACMKKCIAGGKLHPIQCHSLC
ncbi:uncharacterized protein LOC143037221 [Oratosquilla oratoria]|uniref:uncharacterized protein LOC143037221 n=1 Tax=Oratosquilla oratoria TaxID=337810 RepID=UPI003F75A404